MATHICPTCHQPLRADIQGTMPRRINGELVFTATMILVTCDTVGCNREGITREVNAFYAMTETEVMRYNRKTTVQS